MRFILTEVNEILIEFQPPQKKMLKIKCKKYKMPDINNSSLDSELDEILATNGSQNNATKSTITDQEAATIYVSSSIGMGLGILYALINGRGFWAFIGFWIAGSVLGTAVGLGLVFSQKKK